jgi:hypothetical protein
MASFEERYVSDFAVIGGTIFIGSDATGRIRGRPARSFQGKDHPWPAGTALGPGYDREREPRLLTSGYAPVPASRSLGELNSIQRQTS